MEQAGASTSPTPTAAAVGEYAPVVVENDPALVADDTSADTSADINAAASSAAGVALPEDIERADAVDADAADAVDADADAADAVDADAVAADAADADTNYRSFRTVAAAAGESHNETTYVALSASRLLLQPETYLSDGMMRLSRFLRNHAHARAPGRQNPAVTAFEIGGASYIFAPEEFRSLLGALELCRRDGIARSFAERQYSERVLESGFMFDFDFAVPAGALANRDPAQLRPLAAFLALRLLEALEPAGGAASLVFPLYVATRTACTPLPADPMLDQGTPRAKWGIHVYVPTLRAAKPLKLVVMRRLAADPRLAGVLARLGAVGAPRSRAVADAFDLGAATAPMMLFGSLKRTGGVPYTLAAKFVCDAADLEAIRAGVDQPAITPAPVAPEANLTAALSLTALGPAEDGQTRIVCVPAPGLAGEVAAAEAEPAAEPAADMAEPEAATVATLCLRDARADTIRQLLEMLPPQYSADYTTWRLAIFAIGHESARYRLLADWFTQRSGKWDGVPGSTQRGRELEQVWERATSARFNGQGVATLGTIRFWAQRESPEAYARLAAADTDTLLRALIHENGGELEHEPVARLLYALYGHRFMADRSETDLHPIWFEFVDDRSPDAEEMVWKWRRDKFPDELRRIMRAEFTQRLQREISVFEEAAAEAEGRGEQATAKSRLQVAKALRKSVAGLGNRVASRFILEEASLVFRRKGVLRRFDSDGTLFGVQNGILQLPRVLRRRRPAPGVFEVDYAPAAFVAGPHMLLVSRGSPVAYRPFDPTEPHTAAVLRLIADIIVEPDARVALMMIWSTGLAVVSKNGRLVLVIGAGSNGKTTMMELIANALKTRSAKASIQLITDARGRADGPSPHLMALRGVGFAYCEESNAGQQLQTDCVKELVNPGTLSARGLYQEQTEFAVTATLTAASNFDFRVTTSDHGTWRRLLRYFASTKFTPHPDPRNPHEKPENIDCSETWPRDPEYLSAMLSILVHFYTRFIAEFGGDIGNLRSATLAQMTAEFRNSQDYLNRFLSERCVLSPGAPPLPAAQVAAAFAAWYTATFGRTALSADEIGKQLEVSQVSRYLARAPNGTREFRGVRILGPNENAPAEHETFAIAGLNDAGVRRNEAGYAVFEEPAAWWDWAPAEWPRAAVANVDETATVFGTPVRPTVARPAVPTAADEGVAALFAA